MSIGPPVNLGSNQALTGNTCVVTTTVDAPVGALVGVMICPQVSTGQLTGVSDSSVNPYIIAHVSATEPVVNVAYSASLGTVLSAGSTITATFSGTNPAVHMGAFYITGLVSSNVRQIGTDINGTSAQSTGTISGTGPLVTPNEIICVFLSVNETGLAGTSVIDGGSIQYTPGILLDARQPNMELWYSVVASTTPPTPSASWTSAPADWGLTMVSFIGLTIPQTAANTPCGISGG